MNFSNVPAASFILEQLTRRLPPELTYHSAEHTIEVFEITVELAKFEHRAERELELLALAASFHDAGFLVRRRNHEAVSASIAEQELPRFGYSPEDIDFVLGLIRDTQLLPTARGPRAIPSHELSQYLLDADVGNFGREDFFEKLTLVAAEEGWSIQEGRKRALALLRAHDWYTRSAAHYLEPQKLRNLQALEELVQQDESTSDR